MAKSNVTLFVVRDLQKKYTTPGSVEAPLHLVAFRQTSRAILPKQSIDYNATRGIRSKTARDPNQSGTVLHDSFGEPHLPPRPSAASPHRRRRSVRFRPIPLRRFSLTGVVGGKRRNAPPRQDAVSRPAGAWKSNHLRRRRVHGPSTPPENPSFPSKTNRWVHWIDVTVPLGVEKPRFSFVAPHPFALAASPIDLSAFFAVVVVGPRRFFFCFSLSLVRSE